MPARLPAADDTDSHSLLRGVLVGWVLVRVMFFTVLWLGVLLLAFLGYFAASIVFFGLASIAVSAVGARSNVLRMLRRTP